MPYLPVLAWFLNRIFQAILVLLMFLMVAVKGYSQQSTFFTEPEIMVGKNVPNYPDFPEHKLRTNYLLNIGFYRSDSTRAVNEFYNLPHTGVSLGYSDLGNQKRFGNEYTITPYIKLNLTPRLKHSVLIKLGMGASYITRTYYNERNWYNEAISTDFSWNFQAFIYYSFLTTSRINLQIGGGFWHTSNAHIQLPNFGLNSAMLSLSGSYYWQQIDPEFSINKEDLENTRKSFFQSRSGLGMHVLGGTAGPKKGPKQPVYTQAFFYGYRPNRQLKLYTGIFYRFYNSYYEYINNNYDEKYGNATLQASNFNLFFGGEFLIGHIGMNAEGGINLYKPFYEDYYEIFRSGENSFNFWVKKTINTRLGLNLYLINTRKMPRHNLALGVHINANLGTADFGELSLTYKGRFW